MKIAEDVRMAAAYLPAVLMGSASFVLIFLNNFVDQIYINQSGVAAARAYSIALPMYWMILAIAGAFGAGALIVVRSHLAKGDIDAANQSVCNSLVYCAILGSLSVFVVYSIVFTIFDRTLEDRDVFDALQDFLSPFIFLFAFIAVNSILCTLMAIDGGAKVTLTCLLLSLIANIILDPIFVKILDMGPFGNGLATVLGMSLSGLLAVGWFVRGKGRLRISFRHFKPSFRGIMKSFRALWQFLIKSAFSSFCELIIRLQLYISYALSYGVPMLCTGLAYVLCSGSRPALAGRYKELSENKDCEGAKSLFRGSTIMAFSMMWGFTAIVFIFSDPLVSLFTQVPGLTESHHVVLWTFRTMCFCAPFIGLKSVCSAAYAPFDESFARTTAVLAMCVLRTVLFLSFLTISYRAAIWYFLTERILTGAYYFVATAVYIPKKYSAAVPQAE